MLLCKGKENNTFFQKIRNLCYLNIKLVFTIMVVTLCTYPLHAKSPDFTKELVSKTKIPFHDYCVSSTDCSVDLYCSKKNPSVTILAFGPDNILFDNEIPVKILFYKKNHYYVISRNVFSKGFNLYIVDLDQKNIDRMQLPSFLEKDGYFREAVIHNNNLYIVNYVPKKFNNSLNDDVNGDHNVLHKIKIDECGLAVYDSEIKRLSKDVDIRYGIDRRLFMFSFKNDLVVCAADLCEFPLSQSSPSFKFPSDYFVTEAVSNGQVAFACLVDSLGKSLIYDLEKKCQISNSPLPFFSLEIDKSNSKLSYNVLSPANREDYLKHQIMKNKDSGFLECGMDNDQARIAWSQVYYLNLFIDILSPAFSKKFSYLSSSFKKQIRTRLEFEINLLDKNLHSGVISVSTTRYSAKAQPAVYAVQTGRILRLLKRYDSFLGKINSLKRFSQETCSLKNHEEIQIIAKENNVDNLPVGRISLHWPHGNNFPFDGFNIPFNHQNDWVSGVVHLPSIKKVCRDIILTFIENSGIEDCDDKKYQWKYWYGRVSEPWDINDNLSINTPIYVGDKGFADISYMSIDTMAFLAVSKHFPELRKKNIIEGIKLAIMRGDLMPFVQEEFCYSLEPIVLNKHAISKYLRCDSAWCLQNLGWALCDFK